MTLVRIIDFLIVTAIGVGPEALSARGTSLRNSKNAPTTNTSNTANTIAIATTPDLSPRAKNDASNAIKPIVSRGNVATLPATVPNSHSGDLNDAGYHCSATSMKPTTANNKPNQPSMRHAVRGAVTEIGFRAFLSA